MYTITERYTDHKNGLAPQQCKDTISSREGGLNQFIIITTYKNKSHLEWFCHINQYQPCPSSPIFLFFGFKLIILCPGIAPLIFDSKMPATARLPT